MRNISLFTVCLLATLTITAQATMEVVANNLRMPAGIEFDDAGNLWIGEQGTGHDDGAVTVIWANGKTERVINRLPSTIHPETKQVLGTTRARMLDKKHLAVFTGTGIHIFDRSKFGEGRSALSEADASIVIETDEFVKYMGYDESNPYSMVYDGRDMYIADAGANIIIRRKGLTGKLEVFAELPEIKYTLQEREYVVEAVPTRIIPQQGGGFLVATFSGYPFPEGAAKIFAVDVEGNVEIAEKYMTMLTDVAAHPSGNGWLTLEFGQFFPGEDGTPVPNSGRIIRLFDDQSRELVAAGFGPSGGMAVFDEETIYVTDLSEGTVVRLSTKATNME